jgi:hypothetical protein
VQRFAIEQGNLRDALNARQAGPAIGRLYQRADDILGAVHDSRLIVRLAFRRAPKLHYVHEVRAQRSRDDPRQLERLDNCRRSIAIGKAVAGCDVRAHERRPAHEYAQLRRMLGERAGGSLDGKMVLARPNLHRLLGKLECAVQQLTQLALWQRWLAVRDIELAQ